MLPPATAAAGDHCHLPQSGRWHQDAETRLAAACGSPGHAPYIAPSWTAGTPSLAPSFRPPHDGRSGSRALAPGDIVDPQWLEEPSLERVPFRRTGAGGVAYSG